VFWHDKGWRIYTLVQDYIREQLRRAGYQEVNTPEIVDIRLWEKSGHADKFIEDMFLTASENRDYAIKPMNCPCHVQIYNQGLVSYRDLPLLLNQWANVMRWEMRTRMFLRTTEFLCQEGHTAHATAAEGREETLLMIETYRWFDEEVLAMPVICGAKTANERFASAVEPYSIEAMMQDRKALQAGTSHFLGQNFSKAQEIMFQAENGERQYAWTTSWGVSTRLVGALIMTHSDDKGLVLPPNLAPIQVVIVPIYKTEEQLNEISVLAKSLMQQFKEKGISVKYDDSNKQRPGAKFAQYELQGVPVRIAIGPKDLENKTVELARRDIMTKENVSLNDLIQKVENLMIEIQKTLFNKASDFRDSHITEVHTFDEFKHILENKTGFVSAHWDGTHETEKAIKDLTKATIRCIPVDAKEEEGTCIYSGKPSTKRVLFAKAY